MDLYDISADPQAVWYWAVSDDEELVMIVKKDTSEVLLALRFELWSLSSTSSVKPVLRSRGKFALFNALVRDTSENAESNVSLASEAATIEDSLEKDTKGRLCFTKNLEYLLLGDYIYGFIYRTNGMSIQPVRFVGSLDSHPPIQWLIYTNNGQFFFGGTQNPCLEDSLRCGQSGLVYTQKPRPLAVPEDDQRLVYCNLCYLIQSIYAGYRCQSCDDFDICFDCVGKGGWCPDRGHRLRSEIPAVPDMIWRFSHCIFNSPGPAPLVSSCHMRERYSTAIENQPEDCPGNNCFYWLLDEQHILVFNYEKNRLSVLTLGQENLTCK